MDIVLKDCTSFSCVYIDDILIWSPTWQQHLEDLRHVFGSLRKAGLTCRTEKCEFGKTKLQFLGHYIGNGTLSVPEDRVTAMAEYQRPRTRKQLRSFLGTINYYRKFIPRFHQQSILLTPAISKAAPATVVWDEAMERAFCELKTSLCKRVCLYIPVCSDVYVLETDACRTGVGSVLSVKRDGQLLPVAFYSCQLHGAEKHYSAQELEGLALMKSIHFFSFYLYGRKFHVITDHKPHLSIVTKPQENRRLLRWALKGARTPPTQFFVDGCYARLLLFVYLQGLLHYNTRTKYLPKEPLANFRANLEEISGPGYKTLGHFFGAVR